MQSNENTHQESPDAYYEQRYNELYQQLIARGFSPKEAQQRTVTRIGQIRSEEEAAQRKQKLQTIDSAIIDKVIYWRSNAFSDAEIVQKLVDKFTYSEEEAKQVMATIRAEQATTERVVTKVSEITNERHNYKLGMGVFLLVGGLLIGFICFLLEQEDFYLYAFGTAIGGLIQIIATAGRKQTSD